MNIRFLLLLITALGLSTTANAQWQAGVSYAQFSSENNNVDLTLGALVGTLGYQLNRQSTFNHIFQLKGGLGVTDDSVGGFDVELDRFIQLAYRAEFDFTNELYAFFTPSFGNVKASASGFGFNESDDEWELGVGVGAGIDISDSLDAEIAYESFDGTDVLSIGARFSF